MQDPLTPTSIPEVIVTLCGMVYFSAWTFSFYPQLWRNYRRRSTTGFSADFAYINPIGFVALMTWTWGARFSPVARQQYADRHDGHKPQVSDADLAFSLHALVITILTVLQVLYYNRRKRSGLREPDERSRLIPTPAEWSKIYNKAPADNSRPSLTCRLALLGICIGTAISAISVWAGYAQFLDFLYFVSSVKLFVSLVKYIPQIVLIQRLGSAEGLAIWQVITDVIGSIFSFTQLVVSSIWIEHDPSGIVANPAKLGLAGLSFLFDGIMLTQRYILFRGKRIEEDGGEQEQE